MVQKTRVLALTMILWMPSALRAAEVARDYLPGVEALTWPQIAAPVQGDGWPALQPGDPQCRARWAGLLKWARNDRVDVGGDGAGVEGCGAIFGKVLDDPGNALPGTTVTLTGTKASWVLTTNEQGAFAFVGLPAGTFTVKAELEGFFSFEARGIRLVKGQTALPELRLPVNPDDVITIIEETPLISH